MASNGPSNTARDNLVAIAKAYAKAKRLSINTVSKRFHGKQRFFRDFAAGKSTVTLSKLDEMLSSFRAQWPDDTPWPDTRAIFMQRR